MPQKQGPATHQKEGFFSACLGHYMKLVMARYPREVYWHLDMNAGCGRNREQNVKGSPEIFCNKLSRYPDRDIRAWFVEKRRSAYAQLKNEIGARQGELFGRRHTLSAIFGDANVMLTEFSRAISRNAMGSIISDPNGYSTKRGGVDLALAQAVLSAHPRMMFLAFFPAGGAKRVRQYQDKPSRASDIAPRAEMERRSVGDYLPLCRHWLFKEQYPYVYLCGTSVVRMNDWRKVGIYHLDSPQGEVMMRRFDGDRVDHTHADGGTGGGAYQRLSGQDGGVDHRDGPSAHG